MESDKAGYLTAAGSKDPRDNLDKALILEFSQDAERRRLGTPWFLTEGGYLRVTVAIVGPKRRCPEDKFCLGRGEAQDALQAISDLVISLTKELR